MLGLYRLIRGLILVKGASSSASSPGTSATSLLVAAASGASARSLLEAASSTSSVVCAVLVFACVFVRLVRISDILLSLLLLISVSLAYLVDSFVLSCSCTFATPGFEPRASRSCFVNRLFFRMDTAVFFARP